MTKADYDCVLEHGAIERDGKRWAWGIPVVLPVTDEEAALLAEEVSRRVEAELEYPGQIKIMVIRETRATSFAK